MPLMPKQVTLTGPAYHMTQFTKLVIFLMTFSLKWLKLVFHPKLLQLDQMISLGTIQKLAEPHARETE